MMNRFSLLLLFSVFLSDTILAQQSNLMSHYMFNTLLLNPAYAGSKEFVSTTLNYRRQWTGIEGAPVTYSGSAHGLLKNKKLGLGGYIQQDEIGVTRQLDAYFSAAYHLELGLGKLSVGLQAGLSSFNSELVKLNYWDQDDEVFSYNTFSSLLPNAGLGVYYYQPMFYAGISMPFVLNYDPYMDASVGGDARVHGLNRRAFFSVGGVIDTEKDLKIKPAAIIRFEPNSDISFDVGVNFLLQDLFWLGASYRYKESVSALLEYQISRKFRIGYSYDYSLGVLGDFNNGSHEIMLGYDFGFDVLKMRSPRYF